MSAIADGPANSLSSAARRYVLFLPLISKHKDVRYFHIHKGEQFDEAQFAGWMKQASKSPGERM